MRAVGPPNGTQRSGAPQVCDPPTRSTPAGYGRKAADRAAAKGAVIGKALGSLDSGSGTIPVMVTLK